MTPATAPLAKLPRLIFIEYQIRGGGVAQREIEAQRFHLEHGRLCLTGYCRIVRDDRTFPVEKITYLKDLETGRIFEGPEVSRALRSVAVALGVELGQAKRQETLPEAQARAIAAFREWAARDDWVLLACATSGHRTSAEILEVAVIDGRGRRLINQRVMPQGPISKAASALHGLTRERLEGAPPWPQIHDRVCRVLAAAPYVLAYDAQFELRLLEQTAARSGLSLPELEFDCVMLAYAAYRAEPGKAWRGQAAPARRWRRPRGGPARRGAAPGADRLHDLLAPDPEDRRQGGRIGAKIRQAPRDGAQPPPARSGTPARRKPSR